MSFHKQNYFQRRTKPKGPRANERIRAPEVQVINSEGKNLGTLQTIKAIEIAKQEGLDQIFKDSGFQWREPGCSMCLAMNSDKLIGNQISASSSNRNFKGRQGSPSGRTLLMSPAMVAAAAITFAV